MLAWQWNVQHSLTASSAGPMKSELMAHDIEYKKRMVQYTPITWHLIKLSIIVCLGAQVKHVWLLAHLRLIILDLEPGISVGGTGGGTL